MAGRAWPRVEAAAVRGLRLRPAARRHVRGHLIVMVAPANRDYFVLSADGCVTILNPRIDIILTLCLWSPLGMIALVTLVI